MSLVLTLASMNCFMANSYMNKEQHAWVSVCVTPAGAAEPVWSVWRTTTHLLLTRSRFELQRFQIWNLTEKYDYSNDMNTFNLNSTAWKIKDNSRDLVASEKSQLTQGDLLPGELNNLVKLANVWQQMFLTLQWAWPKQTFPTKLFSP